MEKLKKKEKKKIEFNLADYDYMDNTRPLVGWVWEFMRRSDEYKKFWETGPRSEGYKAFWGDEAGNPDIFCVGDKRWVGKDPSEKWTNEYLELLDLSLHEVVSKSKPVDVTNMRWRLKGHYEFGRTFDLDQYSSIKVSSDYDSEGIVTHVTYWMLHWEKSHPFEKLRQVADRPNVVMALIDISAPESIKNFLSTIRTELLFWRKRLKLPKVKDAKVSKIKNNELIKKAKIWKSYLMVYDLLNNGIKPAEATDILSKYDDKYSEMNTVIRHNERAKALINGGYKKYL